MEIANKPLVLDLVEWIAHRPRPYPEVMEAWRTSCPRLPVWEDALEHGLVVCAREDGVIMVRATPTGRALLDAARPGTPSNG